MNEKEIKESVKRVCGLAYKFPKVEELTVLMMKPKLTPDESEREMLLMREMADFLRVEARKHYR